jgi:hypothetical protein
MRIKMFWKPEITRNNLKFALAAMFAFCLLLAGFEARAAVAVDTASRGGAFNSTGVTNLQWQHTVTTGGIHRVLYVAVSTSADGLLPGSPTFPICIVQPALCQNSALGNSAGSRVTSVTYNGDPLQSVGRQVAPDLRQSIEMFRLVNPDEGTHTVEVTLVPGLSYNVVGGSVSFTGANENPNVLPQFYSNSGTFNSATGTGAPSVSVANGGASGIAFGAVATTPNAGYIFNNDPLQTQLYDGEDFFFNSYDVGAGSTKSATPSATLNWAFTNSGDWATGGVAVQSFVPTAATVSIGGRVLTQSGRGVSNARISLTDQNGETRSVMTNPFGYYRFKEVESGATYVFNVFSKRYTFAPQAVTVTEELRELNFIAEP